MASNVHVSVAARNSALDIFDALLNGGKLRIYDGTQPANVATAITSQVLLADLALNATAFTAASAGSKTANAITDDTSADASGTATWGSLLKSDNTRVVDFSVGTSGADCNFNSVAIAAGAKVSVTSLVLSMSA